VLSPDWEAVASGVATGFMVNATVNLRKPGGTETWNEGLGRTVLTPNTPFASAVPANIEGLAGGGAPSSVEEEQIYVLGYRVAVPRDTAPSPSQMDEGVQVDVITCADPMLVGATLKVNDVVRGSFRFQRVLLADLNS